MVNTSERESLLPIIVDDKIEYGGKNYTLIPLSNQDVLDTGISEDNMSSGVLAIQDNMIYHSGIPEGYLQYAILNEILCDDVREQQGKCLSALKQEIEFIPLEIKGKYLAWRHEFFKKMYSYYTDDYEDKFYAAEMKACYIFIESLQDNKPDIDITKIM